jgi:hypothetical protein
MTGSLAFIERVARALCRLDGHPENAIMDGKPLWMDFVPEARAAIEAMREPSPEILAVLERLLDTQGHHQTLEESWDMLITAAIGEGE